MERNLEINYWSNEQLNTMLTIFFIKDRNLTIDNTNKIQHFGCRFCDFDQCNSIVFVDFRRLLILCNLSSSGALQSESMNSGDFMD